MAIATVGIDLAKSIFSVHGVGESGKPELVRSEVQRGKLLELIAHLSASLIGMEACSGAHYWAREFQRFGHTVKLMAPKFVAPYRMGSKHGENNAGRRIDHRRSGHKAQYAVCSRQNRRLARATICAQCSPELC